jgi:hypothetical protein
MSYAQSLSSLAASGQQQKLDVQQRYKAMQGGGVQDLVSRGLMASTVLPTMKMGYAREMEGAMGRVDSSINQQRSSIFAQQAQAQMQAHLQKLQMEQQNQQFSQNMAYQYAGLNQQRSLANASRRPQSYSGFSINRTPGNYAGTMQGTSSRAVQRLRG